MRFSLHFCILIGLLLTPFAAIGQNIDMGDAYRELDARAISMVSEFPDATATTLRSATGELTTEVRNQAGSLVARWFIPTSGPVTVSSGNLAGGSSTVARPEFDPSTDWANLQAVSLWKDLRKMRQQTGLTTDSAQLVWSGSFLRPWQLSESKSGTPASRAAVLKNEVLAIKATFVTHTGVELFVQSIKENQPSSRGKRGGTTAHATFTTELFDPSTSTRLGLLRWFKEPKVLVWSFPGVTEGWVDPERQLQEYPFEPDLAWGAVQAFGFWSSEAIDSLAKTVTLKDTPGCTGLHWLDGSIYEKCCNEHDKCFAKYGCNATSWWIWGAGWSRIRCNIEVVQCFVVTFIGGGGGGPAPDGGDNPCNVSGSEWCPAECSTCSRTL